MRASTSFAVHFASRSSPTAVSAPANDPSAFGRRGQMWPLSRWVWQSTKAGMTTRRRRSFAAPALSGADGSIAFFNLAGSVELSVDVVGYYVPADTLASEVSSDLAGLTYTVNDLQTEVDGLTTPVEIVSTPISVPGNVTAQLSTEIASLTTTATGRWSISSVWNMAASCSSGTSYLAFLLVDDVIVPSTMVSITGSGNGRTAFIGITADSIVAGAHTVKVGAWCYAGTVTGIGGVPNSGVTNVTVLR